MIDGPKTGGPDQDERPEDDHDDGGVDPLEGLMDPDEGANSPAADADAPPPA